MQADALGMHSFQVVAGLTMLDRAGEVDLTYVCRSRRELPAHRQTPWIEVHDHDTRQWWRVCIDLADGPNLDGGRHELADVVFKRSLDPAEVPDDLPAVRRPYGLSYRCRSGLEGRMLTQTVLSLPSAAARVKNNQPWREWAKEAAYPLLQPIQLERATRQPHRSVPSIPRLVSQFEIPPGEPAEPLVLFQTRVWPFDDRPSHASRPAFNEERADLIRTLRRRLGDRFCGGLQPSPEARALYPDCLTDLPHERVAYLGVVRRCAIVVTTPGLLGANPATLAECLAGSRAVVSKPLRYPVPRPLDEPDQISYFADAEACADACEQLLDDPDLVAHRRQQAWDYYRREVRPDALLRNRLTELAGLA